jgi:hypothetical protein
MTGEWILSIGGMRMTGENGSTQRKARLIAALLTKNPALIGLVQDKRYLTLTITNKNSVGILHLSQVCHRSRPVFLYSFALTMLRCCA